jgi:phenylalanyl-tRNA synthetase beta chain
MLINKQWLEDYVKIPESLSPQELSDLLTTRVVEIEGFQDGAEILANIFVGRVLSIQKHPNADKLNICTVEFGQVNPAQVVCGGSNVTGGMLCAFGALGAKVRWHGEGDLIELKKTKIRDAESYGMICASEEIGLGEMFPKGDEKEILDLSDMNLEVGKPLAEALGLGDIVFDIDNKSLTHRPDLWGHYGIAREVAALLNKKLKPLDPPSIVEGSDQTVSVDIKAKDACYRFMGVLVEGITIEPSPAWMQQRLLAVGVRPINNLVDITNYVMYELGQPTHAYDADKFATNKDGDIHLTIRYAKKDEEFITLDGNEHKLSKNMFVIADSKQPVLLGGIMGGQNSEVDAGTTRVLFESANFDATVVRKTSQSLGLRTDGSARWEKSQDPTNAEIGLRRLVELTKKLCPDARVVSNVVDEGSYSIDQGPIEVDVSYFEHKIGVSIKKKRIVSILTDLGFVVDDRGEVLSVTVPTWRATKDIRIKEDLVEEVARMHGFENIPEAIPRLEMHPAPVDPILDLERRFTKFLAHEGGCTQTLNYSFVSPQWLQKLGEDVSGHIELDRPLAKDRPLLRRHLVGGLLENVESNLHRFDTVNIFETGRVYRSEESGAYADDKEKKQLPKQYTLLAMAYAAKGEEQPFFHVTSRFVSVAARMGIQVIFEKKEGAQALVHPGRFADVVVAGTVIGHVAEVHPSVLQTVGIPYRTAILEVNLDLLSTLLVDAQTYQPLPQYPVIERDIAFLVDTSVEHDDIAAFLIESDLLTVNVELFDVYQGDKVPEGKKSMAYRITYRSDDKTLLSGEVDEVHGRIIEALKKKFEVEVR